MLWRCRGSHAAAKLHAGIGKLAAFKQAGRRAFTGFSGIPLLSLPGKLHVDGHLGFVGK